LRMALFFALLNFDSRSDSLVTFSLKKRIGTDQARAITIVKVAAVFGPFIMILICGSGNQQPF
jgi:hypothetical protein